MTLEVFQFVAISLLALVLGVFWGPWIALTRSLPSFRAEAFLGIVHQMDRNLAPLMTVLMPLVLVSFVPVLILSHGGGFVLGLAGLVAFIASVLVTVVIEVPIVARIRTWTDSTVPAGWEQQRDRWVAFHGIRVTSGFLGFCLLLAAALFFTR